MLDSHRFILKFLSIKKSRNFSSFSLIFGLESTIVEQKILREISLLSL